MKGERVCDTRELLRMCGVLVETLEEMVTDVNMVIERVEDARSMRIADAYKLCEMFPGLAIVVYDGKRIEFIWED